MAKQFQFRRGTTAENDAFKGAPGELTYDIERKELRIHDGVTLGGKRVEPSTNVVHTIGDETINNTKTFTSQTRRATSLERGVVPSANTNVVATQFMDKKSKVLGELEYFYGTNGKNGMSLLLYDSSGNRGAGLRIGQNSDGTTYASAPTPASTSNSTDVATTAWVRDLFETLYPVGSLYITSENTTTCPLTSIVKKSDGTNSSWSLVASGKALWTGTGSNGNTTIDAGLPNITGQFVAANSAAASGSGAFNVISTADGKGWDGTSAMRSTYGFDASRSSTVYRNDVTTVQPPAYVANVWRRTA